jgi:hypothetical protein
MQFTAMSDSYHITCNITDCNQRHLNRFLNRCLLHVINSLLLTAIIDGYNRFFAWHMPLTTRFPHAYAHDQFHTASILPKTLTQSSYSPSDQDTLLLECSFFILRLHRVLQSIIFSLSRFAVNGITICVNVLQ